MHEFEQRAREAFETKAKANAALLQAYHPDTAIERLDAMTMSVAFDFYDQNVKDLWAAVERDFGKEGLDAFQGLTMLRLVSQFSERAKTAHHYTDAALANFVRHFDRIIPIALASDRTVYPMEGYLFRMDLALCRQKVVPTIFEVLDTYQSFPRNLAFKKGIGQFLGIWWFSLRYGHHSYYEMHYHPVDGVFMSRDNLIRLQLMMADLLEINPDTKGLIGPTFLTDPELPKYSPHLAYIRELHVGTTYFYAGLADPESGPLTSKSRRQAYERGEYIPKIYYQIWVRHKIVDWARKFRANNPDYDESPDYSPQRPPAREKKAS
jgi:hypothetical protein